MNQILKLPARLDSSGAPVLVSSLLARRGTALTIDASEVEVCGALAMEVLVAAGRQWQADGADLRITGASARFLAACEALALAPDAPWHGAPQDAGAMA